MLASDTFSGIIKGMFGEKPCVFIEMESGAVHILSYVVPSGKPARRVLCLFCEEKPPLHSSLSISIVFRHKQMSSLPKGSSPKSGSKTEETDVKPQQYLTCLHALIISTLAEGGVLFCSVLFICLVSALQYGRIKDISINLIFKISIRILLNTYMLIISFRVLKSKIIQICLRRAEKTGGKHILHSAKLPSISQAKISKFVMKSNYRSRAELFLIILMG